MPLVLPTTLVGSYSVPAWLARLKDDHLHHRLSDQHLEEISDVAIKAALKDQELAGLDIVTDGELRRDNDIDYLLARIPGVELRGGGDGGGKDYYYDYVDAEVVRPLGSDDADDGDDDAACSLGLDDEFRFTVAHTDRPIKVSLTGPFSLSRRLADRVYGDDAGLVLALAEVLHAEAARLAAAGATRLQLDEPFLAGYPEHVELAMRAVNVVTEGVDVTWSLHVCYGNRYARPSWEGHYDFLFPAVLDVQVDQLMLEFARKGDGDLALIGRHGWDRQLGLGVIDVKSDEIEAQDVIAARIRRALDVVPADRLSINPDCGLRHVPPDVARAKLRSMVSATDRVRSEL
ncbi:MAG: hypothetical protein ACR2HP_00295 [Ilumatobacteraceae bacterium]